MSMTLADAALSNLWTDAPNALSRLDQLVGQGVVSAGLSDSLAHFIKHGWLIMPRAIEPALTDRFVHHIRGLHRHPGMFVRTDHRLPNDGRMIGPNRLA